MLRKLTPRPIGILAFILFYGSAPSIVLAVDKGERIFKHCATCHGADGAGNREVMAPSIAGLPDWYLESTLYKFMNGGRGAHFRDIPGLRMRPMARHIRNRQPTQEPNTGAEESAETQDTVKALARYIASMPVVNNEVTVDGNPLRGQNKYNQVCIACHGPDGKGVRATNAPSLVALDDWYMLEQLKKFKNGHRAYDSVRDPMGATMAPMARLLESEEVMADVIAYIKALNDQ